MKPQTTVLKSRSKQDATEAKLVYAPFFGTIYEPFIFKRVTVKTDTITTHGRLIDVKEGRLSKIHSPTVLLLEKEGRKLIIRGWKLIALTGYKRLNPSYSSLCFEGNK